MKRLMSKESSNKGFTIVSLIIIVVILVIVAIIAIPLIIKSSDKSKIEADRKHAQAIADAIIDYYVDPLTDPELQVQHKATVILTTTPSPLIDGTVKTANAKGHTKEALEAAGIFEVGLKSDTWNRGMGMVTITVDIDNYGTLTVKANDNSLLGE